ARRGKGHLAAGLAGEGLRSHPGFDRQSCLARACFQERRLSLDAVALLVAHSSRLVRHLLVAVGLRPAFDRGTRLWRVRDDRAVAVMPAGAGLRRAAPDQPQANAEADENQQDEDTHVYFLVLKMSVGKGQVVQHRLEEASGFAAGAGAMV